MRMLYRQERTQARPAYFPSAVPQKLLDSPQRSDQFQIANQEEQTFSISMGQHRKSQQNIRKIKRSVINRACINVTNYSCKALTDIPPEIMKKSQIKLSVIQKLDLSYNNLWDISGVFFEQMSSLKELILNDNKISQLPVSQINKCRCLKLINVNNNQIYILHAFSRISYLQAKNNPFNMITAQLVKLTNLQFFSFDWLQFLLDNDSDQYEDKYKEYTLHYSTFKKNILQKIDYQNKHNNPFCDFDCYFRVRFTTATARDSQMLFLSKLIVKSIYKNSSFFFNYLKSFHNQINYAKLTHNNKLLLEVVFESNCLEALQLFCLKKSNYSQLISDQVYFQSLKLCCRYSNYQMYRYLFEIKKRRKRVHNSVNVSTLIHQVLYRYNRQKNSDKMLFQLLDLYKDISGFPISIEIPHQFNSRSFKALSSAILDIYQHEWMFNYFHIDYNKCRTTPLHFAMKSRNEQLLKLLLGQDWNVFQKNQNGLSCKFTPGCTQVSRKMVWKHEKALIKKHFRQNQSLNIPEMKQKIPKQPLYNLNQSIKNRIGYPQLQNNFILYRSPKQQLIKCQNQPQSLFQSIRKESREQILPHLIIRAKQLHVLNWSREYLKKIINIDIISFLLQKLQTAKQDNLSRRNQMSRKTSDVLVQIFQLVGKQNALIQFQIIQVIQNVNQKSYGRGGYYVDVQSQKITVDHNSFWCCQAIGYQ